MEAFFRKDQEIQELIDLFIEKLLTVNILSGSDADSEFYRGRQAVEKIALLFKEMAELPDEALIDGIRQLVEQRLPDSRVIENFPNFNELMNDMIQAGLHNSIAIPAFAKPAISSQLGSEQKIASISSSGGGSLPPSSKITLNGGRSLIVDTQNSVPAISLRQHIFSQPPELESNTELFQELKSEFDIKPEFDITKDALFEAVTDLNNQEEENQSTIVTDIFTDLSEITQAFQLDLDTVENVSDIEQVSDIENVSEIQNYDVMDIQSETRYAVPMIVESFAEEKQTPINLKNKECDIALETISLVLDEKKVEVKIEILEQEEAKLELKKNVSTENDSDNEKDKDELEAKFAIEKANQAPLPSRRDPFRFNPKRNTPPSTSPSAQPKKQEKTQLSRVVRTSQMPADSERLVMVLNRIFPNSLIHWNVSIGKNTFYAQVDKLLIYILETELELDTRHIEVITASMRKQGWKIFVCLKEDLGYPRRLERGIRSAIR